MAAFIARARKSFKKSSPKKKTTSLDFDDDEIFNNNLHKVSDNWVKQKGDFVPSYSIGFQKGRIGKIEP